MNSKLPSHEEKDDITSLVSRSTSELATRASLIGRGLRDISERLRDDSLEVAQDEAMQLLKQERLDEAIAICNAALATDPVDESFWQIKGVCLAKQGKVEEGLDCFDRALESNSGNPHCWFLKSRLLLRVNRTEEQLECLRRVIGIESDFNGAWREIGGCLFALGRFAEAAQAYDSELKLNPLDEECRSKKQIALITEELGIDWNRPTLLLDIGSWWREPINYPPSTGTRCFNFVCELKFLPDSPRNAKRFYELEYLSDNPREAGKEITVYRRSRTTGEMREFGEALLLHDQEGGPLILELLRAFPEDMSDEDCIRELADDAYQMHAYDPAYGNVILFSWR